MKKRTLITVLVVILSLVIMLTAFACGGKKPPKTKPEDDPIVDEVKVSFKDALNVIIKSADKAFDNFAGVDTAAYYAFTGYINIASGDEVTNFELTVKGNFDETTVANNSGFIEVKNVATNKVVLALYVANNTVYIGETFTAKDLNWVKLSQAKSDEVISGFFAQLPGIVGKALEKFTGKNIIASNKTVTMVTSFAGALGSFFTVVPPPSFDKDTNVNGDYKIGIKVDQLGNILKQDFVAGFLGSVDLSAYQDIINMILPTLLGLELNVGADGSLNIVQKGVIPKIDLEFSIAEGALSKIGISYTKAATDDSKAISVQFGIKNFVAQDTSKAATALKPAYMPENVGEGAIKLTLDLGLAQKGLAATVEAYLVPDIAISYDKVTGFAFDFTGIEAYGIAKFNGKSKELAIAYNAENSTLAFDLAGLYELLDMDAPANTVYYNAKLDLDGFFNKTPAPDAAANAEGEAPVYTNVLDKLIDGVINGIEGGNILGLITGNAGTVLDIFGGLSTLISGSITSAEGTATLNILKLMNDLKTFKLKANDDSALIDSEILADLIGKSPVHYLDLQNILDEIVAATGKTEAEVEALVCEYSGIELANGQSLVEYLTTNGLTLTLNGAAGKTADATKGAGFGFELKAGNNSIAKVGLSIKLVTTADVEAATAGLDFDFETPEGVDLSDDANWDAFVEEMKAILDAFRNI